MGWSLGEPIDNLTKAGNYPSWNTVRARYWKNEALYNASEYTGISLQRMILGKPPIHPKIPVSMDIHHIKGRNILNPHSKENLQNLWPWRHAEVDPFRYYNGPRP